VPAGFLVSNPNGAGEIEGPLEVAFAGLIGAGIGFVIGLLCGSIARVLTMNAVNGMRGGMRWAAYGAGAGALALALFETFN